MTIAVVVLAVAGVVIADSDVDITLILAVDSVITGVLVYLLLLFPLLFAIVVAHIGIGIVS